MFSLLIVGNKNVWGWDSLQWHKVHAKYHENRSWLKGKTHTSRSHKPSVFLKEVLNLFLLLSCLNYA